jgi:tryptophan 7-halogenase
MTSGRTKTSELEWLIESVYEDSEVAPSLSAAGTRRIAPSWRKVGIIGGGTAGYLSALALRRAFPDIDITLVESSRIPIIGVGEATVPTIVRFLHELLQIDAHDFYRRVMPTWKLGIRFEWGAPEPYHFNAPFDWNGNTIGALGSLAEHGDIRDMTTLSMMMERGVSPFFRAEDDSIQSLLPHLPFAYHFDVHVLVTYLCGLVKERGIRHLDRRIVSAIPSGDGQSVAAVMTDEGERLEFDVFIDCSGFQSLLLEKTLHSPYVSFAESLLTDTALAFRVPNGDVPKPYTTAATMAAGWCWNIPQRHDDHMGYVFSSAFIGEEEARREIANRYGGRDASLVKFKSGRHREAWRGNVIAIGNASGFVEPLQSTGVMMIAHAVGMLIDLWPETDECQAIRQIYNKRMAGLWDGLRWFIAVHYKFNNRLNTPFWKEARASVDVSGASEVIAAFAELAPMHLRSGIVRRELTSSREISFFGLAAYDCMLLGQRVPCALPASAEHHAEWKARRDRVDETLKAALPMHQALDLCSASTEWLDELLEEESWVRRQFPVAESLARG